jgi:acetate kinase
MATRTAQAITLGGLSATYFSATATTGDKVRADDRTWITVKNGSGASITVTLKGAGTTDYGVANPDKVITVAASGEVDIPILPAYGNPADGGLATFICSQVTSVTFAARRI